MDFTVCDPEEKTVNDRVDKLMGHDTNLATIVKMSLMPDAVTQEKKDYIINCIKSANLKEVKMYDDEFKMCYDSSANIIEVNTIDGSSAETDSGSKLPEPE